MDLQTALDIVRQRNGDPDRYHEALEYLVDHRDQLKYRIFIVLPGGRTSNLDPSWDKVKAGSVERCDCGNERTIMPTNPRADYLKGTMLTLKPGESAYLRPVGGDRESTYAHLTNDADLKAVTFLMNPFADFVLTLNLFDGPKGFLLTTLADAAGPKGRLYMPQEDTRIPLLRFEAVDLETGIVTIELDQDIENFDPDKEKPRHGDTQE